MALEGVKSDKSEENYGIVPDGKANGIDNKSKQVYVMCENGISLEMMTLMNRDLTYFRMLRLWESHNPHAYSS
ncbi:Uncharacterized protein OBRU01_08056 [Operophtera brumata]|uniref:Uncharacterized protein n=1 Tax=Operophtera brumata TaxID=104452 RepID=A0A0L7LIS8_OPEBR|nr:Uncharacterized protein OBRU01_08056 [Operophtera brumata]